MKQQKFFDFEHKLRNGVINTFIIQMFISSLLFLFMLIILNIDHYAINNIKKNLGNNEDNLENISKHIINFLNKENNNKSKTESIGINSFYESNNFNNQSPECATFNNKAHALINNLPANMPEDLKTFLLNMHFEIMNNIEKYPFNESIISSLGSSQTFYKNHTDYLLNTRINKSTLFTPSEIARESFKEYTLPVDGNITSDFGYRSDPFTKLSSFHNGIDIAVNTGTEVMSVLAGMVLKTGYSKIGGNYIYIQHDNGFISYYGHLKEIFKKKGNIVQNGELLGLSGNSGLTTGPHLHFQLMYNDRPIDPEVYMIFE